MPKERPKASSNGVVQEKTIDEVAFAAAASLEDVEEEEKPKIPVVTLSNGIRLRAKAIPPMLIRQVVTRFPELEVPTFFDEDKGREEPNPAHPDYVAALEKRDQAQYLAVADVAMMLGTEIEFVPEGMSRPEDDDWLAVLEMIDIEVDTSKPKQRYLAWLRYYALERSDDITLVIAAPLSLIGLTEVEVGNAIESFRSAARGRTDNEVRAQDS